MSTSPTSPLTQAHQVGTETVAEMRDIREYIVDGAHKRDLEDLDIDVDHDDESTYYHGSIERDGAYYRFKIPVRHDINEESNFVRRKIDDELDTLVDRIKGST